MVYSSMSSEERQKVFETDPVILRAKKKRLKFVAQRNIERVFPATSKPLTITIGDALKAKGVKIC
jgi:hypothetical protein